MEYVKTDTEGHDVEAVAGMRSSANKTDYIFVEVQDLVPDTAEHNEIGIVGNRSGTVSAMSALLHTMDFKLSYCEENNVYLRQVNCLYRRYGVADACVTGRPQKPGIAETQLTVTHPCHAMRRKLVSPKSIPHPKGHGRAGVE